LRGFSWRTQVGYSIVFVILAITFLHGRNARLKRDLFYPILGYHRTLLIIPHWDISIATVVFPALAGILLAVVGRKVRETNQREPHAGLALLLGRVLQFAKHPDGIRTKYAAELQKLYDIDPAFARFAFGDE
jgi:hypothetical protein